MYCPICAQEPMNCICTEVERQQFSDIEDLEKEIAHLRLTDAEREAIRVAADAYSQNDGDPECERIADILRGLLERHCPTPENQPQQDNTHQTHSTTDEGRMRHEWIPVSERLPEDGEQVIAFFQTHEVGEAVYIKEVNGFEDDRGGCWDASHWMPLPEPPEVKQ